MRVLTEYTHSTGKMAKPLKLAVVSDLHNEPWDDLFAMIEGADLLLVPGDISDRYRQKWERGVAFLREAAQRLPTFYSMGNHERRQKAYEEVMAAIEGSGAQVLINRFVPCGEICIGGWYDPDIVEVPDMLDDFEQQPGVKVLLCHKPEWYPEHLRGRNIDLIVAGHAHGGQIRLFDRGVYAPGQGLLPRYTRGVEDGRMIISAGAGNPARMPRWGNPCEVLMITLK